MFVIKFYLFQFLRKPSVLAVAAASAAAAFLWFKLRPLPNPYYYAWDLSALREDSSQVPSALKSCMKNFNPQNIRRAEKVRFDILHNYAACEALISVSSAPCGILGRFPYRFKGEPNPEGCVADAFVYRLMQAFAVKDENLCVQDLERLPNFEHKEGIRRVCSLFFEAQRTRSVEPLKKIAEGITSWEKIPAQDWYWALGGDICDQAGSGQQSPQECRMYAAQFEAVKRQAPENCGEFLLCEAAASKDRSYCDRAFNRLSALYCADSLEAAARGQSFDKDFHYAIERMRREGINFN